jgi:hypothetical protein
MMRPFATLIMAVSSPIVALSQSPLRAMRVFPGSRHL